MSTSLHHRFPIPSSGLNRLDSQMETLFGQLFGEAKQAKSPARATAAPLPLSLWSDGEHFHLEVDVPGVQLEDLEVSIHEDVLSLKAQRHVEEGRQYAYNGRPFGRFERSLTLPESVDPDSVDARLSAGVLHLTLRKRPEAQARKIQVRQD